MTTNTRATETVRLYDELALEAAAVEGRYQVRTEGGRPVTFFDRGGVLEATATPAQADYLEKIGGYEIVGREPPMRPAAPKVPRSWVEEGSRLAEEREFGKVKAAPEAGGNALVEALIAAIGGPEALVSLLLPQVQPAVLAKAVDAQVEIAQEQAEKEQARDWRYSDLAGRVDPEDAFELLQDYADPGMDLGLLEDAALLGVLARKANEHPQLDYQLAELLAE